MANPSKTQQPDIHRSGQSALNRSYDDDFDVLAQEQLVHDIGAGTLERKGVFGNVGYILFDADDAAPNYIGLNKDADAATSDTTWRIYRFTYSGTAVTSIKCKTGAWTNRATLLP